jgi:tricorn protease
MDTDKPYKRHSEVEKRYPGIIVAIIMKEEKTVQLDEKVGEVQTSISGENLIFSRENNVSTTSFEKAFQSKKPGKEIDLSGLVCRVVPQEEWNQILSDTWRWYRDFFYDKDRTGYLWEKRPYVILHTTEK